MHTLRRMSATPKQCRVCTPVHAVVLVEEGCCRQPHPVGSIQEVVLQVAQHAPGVKQSCEQHDQDQLPHPAGAPSHPLAALMHATWLPM